MLTGRFPAEEVAVPHLLPDDTSQIDPRFIVIGDEQLGLRVEEHFYRRENWESWWELAFPFYQVWLLGNGISGGIDYLRHVPDAGDKTRRMMQAVLYRDFFRNGADFILETGDICAGNGEYPAHWEVFLREKKWESSFLDEIPYLPTVGNHEWANDTACAWPNYEAVFNRPRFYAVEFRDAVLIVLDSNFLIDQWELLSDTEQDTLYQRWYDSDDGTAWLQQTLEHYEDKPFKIVSMHHPPITFGWHKVDWYKRHFGPDLPGKRRQFIDLLHSYGVQVVFSGHEHIYQHTAVEFSGDDGPAQMHFITSSGGGVPIRDRPGENSVEMYRERYLKEGIVTSEPNILAEYHYCLVSVTPDSLVIQTMQVDRNSEEHEATPYERIVIPPPKTDGSASFQNQ